MTRRLLHSINAWNGTFWLLFLFWLAIGEHRMLNLWKAWFVGMIIGILFYIYLSPIWREIK